MSKLREMQEMADLIEKARALGPMTEAQRREQAASFAFGQLALTKQWRDKHADELAELKQMCRRLAGCVDACPCDHRFEPHERCCCEFCAPQIWTSTPKRSTP